MKIRRLCIALLLVAAVADNAIAVTAPKAVNIGSDGERQKPVVLVEDGVAVGCRDKSVTSVEIPAGVTKIGNRAFYGCKALASVVIPESVTEIGSWAFKGCRALASVVIPAGVTEIGESAFLECWALTSVEFGGTVAQWDAVKGKDNLFNVYVHATSVKCADGVWQKPVVLVEGGVAVKRLDKSAASVEIPAGVTEIGEHAFDGCTSLASVVIPESVTKIGNGAFIDCTSLASVVIGAGVTAIGNGAFDGCTELSSVAFGGTKSAWDAVKGKDNLFNGYVPATSVKCADGVWQKPVVLVEDGVAVKCFDKSVTSVVIGASVTKIDSGAFSGCTELSSVAFGGTKSAWDAVKGKDNLFNGYVPATSVKCADGVWQKPVVLVEGGVAVKCLDKSAASVKIPAGVTAIDGMAFWGCKALASVVIPKSVTKIGWDAFEDCTALASVVIPDSVTKIGWEAFKNCKALASVAFGGTVAQWKAVEKESGWHKGVPAKSVKCADGEAKL